MTDRLDVTESDGLPNPADAGSGEVIASPFPEPTPISTDPSKGCQGSTRGPDLPLVSPRVPASSSSSSSRRSGSFLLWRAIPALARNEENFFLYSGNWVTTDTSAMHFGILDLLQVTVFVSVFALLLAMPVALGIAIFLTQYAPRRVSGPLAYMVDLLAAVPSIIYGVWGLYVLAPVIKPFAVWLNENLGWLFLFQTGNASVAGGGTIFTAGIVLAVMILPIITAVTREVFVQTPRGQIEAALALGATRWEVVQDHGAAVRVVRLHQRRDARPRPRARRDDRAADHPARHAARRSAGRCSTPATRSRARSPLRLRNSTTSTRRAPTSPPAWCCSS